ncbi:hypothetical protein GA0074692_6815 [Micromonospora pallida]|uniref:Uncharacterized protein n=1 Tax=Micromonospora pallida TaxID=145854 RepID=A0A1C6TNY9_9ACTN|nr:hypothetical protein GA0074692_6815 [Micromonospora pallida]
MPNNGNDENELLREAKVSILKKITELNTTSVGLKGTLELAMAYTVLDRGKLPARRRRADRVCGQAGHPQRPARVPPARPTWTRNSPGAVGLYRAADRLRLWESVNNHHAARATPTSTRRRRPRPPVRLSASMRAASSNGL